MVAEGGGGAGPDDTSRSARDEPQDNKHRCQLEHRSDNLLSSLTRRLSVGDHISLASVVVAANLGNSEGG